MQFLRSAQFLALGYAQFGWRGHATRKRSFTPGALDVDLSGKHYIVTGASSGLGRATAEALGSRGATVHLVVRNAERAAPVAAAIAEAGGSAQVHVCDLSSLSSVASFAASWGDRRVDALVNNAGVMTQQRADSADGVELNFATNTLGTYALTELLVPALQACNARVVTVSSGGMYTERLETHDLMGDALSSAGRIDGTRQYARNKRQQVALTEHWARKYDGLYWAAMHPGWARTPGVASSMKEFHNAMNRQMRSAEEGADTIVWLTIADEVTKYKSGSFFFDRAVAPTHLFAAGTGYQPQRADSLAEKLREMAETSGVQLPRIDK